MILKVERESCGLSLHYVKRLHIIKKIKNEGSNLYLVE